MKEMLNIRLIGNRIEGRGEAGKRGYPTINLHLLDPSEKTGLFICRVFLSNHRYYDGICHIIDNGIIAEVHILGNYPIEVEVDEKVTIELKYELTKTGSMKDDIEQIRRCSNCKYCTLEDYGYSAWTVLGTTSICDLSLRGDSLS